MLSHPRVGQRAQVWYRKRLAAYMPHHGKLGRIVTVARGPGPRNHEVELEDGTRVGVPRGNLNPVKEAA